MAVKQIGQKFSPVVKATKKRYIVDTESDVATLPTCCPGSTAVVAEGGKTYVVNASNRWVLLGEFGAGALLAAEGVSF